jgi:hypothetical protein
MTQLLDPPPHPLTSKDKGKGKSGGTIGAGTSTPGPELILFTHDAEWWPVALATRRSPAATNRGHELPPGFGAGNALLRLLAEESADIEPLFDQKDLKESSASLTPRAAAPGAPHGKAKGADANDEPVIDLRSAFRVIAPPDRLEKLVKRLSEDNAVDGVFIKPAAEPAAAPQINAMTAAAGAPPQRTPDFTPMQGYLNAAQAGGIDANFAWTQKGGQGKGVQIIDLEGEWRYTHESLAGLNPKLLGGTLYNSLDWRNHGTSVAGIIVSTGNGMGITGICRDAKMSTISPLGKTPWSSAKAIRQAAGLLRSGDVLLLELHRPGPHFNFTNRPQDQKGYIAIEWWPDDFAAIRYATRSGIIVVGAAGNGAEDLDDPLYNNGPTRGRFPSWWKNPFTRQKLDSGGILVGAGAPPSGNFGSDRSRLDFSNYGACVDCQGWGREVVTSGYGDLQGGGSEDRWYTSQFSGTSSASPIVVGAIGCVQGVLRSAKKMPLAPLAARNLLRTTGSPQQPAQGRPVTQRIGPRPDLAALIPPTLLGQSAAQRSAPPGKGMARTKVKKR